MTTFKQIRGLSQVKNYLQKALYNQQISHAYILSGETGSGKHSVAAAFAAALLCENRTDDACGTCPSCVQAASGNHPDIIWVTHEKPASISVDDIRQQVNRSVAIRPYSGTHKVYIIPDGEMMTTQAQNALLKTIEEPPEYVVIILLTTNEQMLLPTITSRCVTLPLRPVSRRAVKNYLMEEYRLPDYEAGICANFAQGNIGKAVKLATQENFSAIKNQVIALARYIGDMSVNQAVEGIKNYKEYKIEIQDFLDFLAVWYRDILLFKTTLDANEVIFHDQLSAIMHQANDCSYDGLEKILQAIDTAKIRLAANVNFDLTMELLVLTIKENIA